jgi:phosphodiesterase/alkaline phosphatase D-like protein
VWLWAGGVTDVGAEVTVKVENPASVRLGFSSSPSFEAIRFVDSRSRGPVYRFGLVDLDPSTTYHYAVEVDGALETARAGSFSTFTTNPVDFTVAFSSCARTGSNASVFDTIRRLEPDLYINTGDLHYGDVMENSLDRFSELYDLTLIQPAQAALYASTPIAYTWDDHDYGPNDAAGDSPSREAALVSYRVHVPHYDFALEGSDAPIAQAFTVGRVRFILTDTRSARDPRGEPDTPEKTMLGHEQLDWLLHELKSATDRYPVVVWVNSVPWIAATELGADHWGGYSHERERIATAIAEIETAGLIMLAGDAHMVAIDDGSNNDYAPQGGARFPVMQAAALDKNGSFKGGPYSEGAFPGGGQFGLLTVTDGGDEIRVVLSGRTWRGEELTSLEVLIPAVVP